MATAQSPARAVRAPTPGNELIKTLAIIGAIPVVIVLLYAVFNSQIFAEDCMFIPCFWLFFTIVTESLLLNWAWKRGVAHCYSTMMVWAAMMCVEGTAGSVFGRQCGSTAIERTFIVVGVWAPLLCNYGAVLIAIAYHSYSDEERARRIRRQIDEIAQPLSSVQANEINA